MFLSCVGRRELGLCRQVQARGGRATVGKGGGMRGARGQGCSVYRSRRRTQVPRTADSRVTFLSLFGRGAVPTPLMALWRVTGVPGNSFIST